MPNICQLMSLIAWKYIYTHLPCPSLYTCKHAFFLLSKKWLHNLSWKMFANGNSGKISITCSCKADSIFKLKYAYTNKYLKRNYFHPNMHPHTDNKLSVHELGSHTHRYTCIRYMQKMQHEIRVTLLVTQKFLQFV